MGSTPEEAAEIHIPVVMVGEVEGRLLLEQTELERMTLRVAAAGLTAARDAHQKPLDASQQEHVAKELAGVGRYFDAITQLELAIASEPQDLRLHVQQLWLQQDVCDWAGAAAAEEVPSTHRIGECRLTRLVLCASRACDAHSMPQTICQRGSVLFSLQRSGWQATSSPRLAEHGIVT